MANNCDTIYKITGSLKAVKDLWNTLQTLEVNREDVWLYLLAEHYGIDYEKRQISVRGHIYYADFGCHEATDSCLLTIETDTAWSGCHDLFRAINKELGGQMSISYREIEPGCNIYYVHDEDCFFPEECCVSSSGEPFEEVYNEVYLTVDAAIEKWCDKMEVGRNGRTQKEMLDLIGEYEYEDKDTYFYIHTFNYE